MKLKQALERQVSYAGMLWLLAAQIAVMLPFLVYLPIWLILVLFASTAWRVRVLRGHWAEPPWPIKAFLIVLGTSGLAFSGLAPLSLDALSSLLLLGFGFKSLEVIHRRDAVVVVYIGYFLIAVQFLYSESIGTALYGAICLTLLTAALIAVQQSPNKRTHDHLKLASLMLAQCLPLMILIYLFFPRLPPLWSVSMPSNQLSRGIQDSMAPGDIAQLTQSADPAFRVTFKGPRPKQHQLYWRGLVLNHFDGREWRQFNEELTHSEVRQYLEIQPVEAASRVTFANHLIEYDVIYEPTEQPWLFTLSPITDWRGKAIMGFDYRLMAKQDLHTPFALSASSYLDSIRDISLSRPIRALSLQLPKGQNPRSRQLAKQWHQQVGSNEAYVRKVLDYFHKQTFYYTLRPPLTGKTDTIDQFLLNTRRGFCSHYSGSFVFMMRAAGIPARVVVGYQGGEWNQNGDYLLVRQYDAHAWAEVWLDGKGWVRHDPTAMVAPSRIEQNLEAAVKAEGSFMENSLFSPIRNHWLSGLRKKWDAIQYGWQRWVLGYDNNAQMDLLQSWLGQVTMARVGLAFAGVFAVIVAIWAGLLGLTKNNDIRPKELKLYHEFCQRLEKRGLIRALDRTPAQFSHEAEAAFPQQAHIIKQISSLFQDLAYRQSYKQQTQLLLRQLNKLIQQL